MSDKKFTSDHEWLAIDGDEVTIGITDFAQEQLGDVVFVELPEGGREISIGEEVAVIESVKAAGGINSPVNGIVSAINETLTDDPELVNRDPQGAAWFFKVKLVGDFEADNLMSESDYQKLLAE